MSDRVKTISATEIKEWRLCPRKWFYRYVRGLRPPPHPSAAFGSEVHHHLAHWLALGVQPPDTPAGDLAREGIPFLPLPGTAISVEGHLLPVTVLPERSVQFVMGPLGGVKDLEYTSYPTSYPFPLRVVHDHKTCGDLRFALNEEALRKDEQGIIYAAHTLESTDEPEVLLEWLYLPRRGRPRPVTALVGRGEVADRLGDLEEDVTTLLGPKGEEQDYEQRISACPKFGGCPYRSTDCKPDQRAAISAMMGAST